MAATASAAIESKPKCCYRRRCVFRLYFGRFSLSHDFRLQTNTFIFCIIISMTTHFHFVCLSSVSFSLLLVLLLRLLCVSAFFARHSIMFIGRLNSIGLCAICMYIVQLNIVQMYFVMWLSNSLIYRNFQLHVEWCLSSIAFVYTFFDLFLYSICALCMLLFYFCPSTSIFTWFSEFLPLFLVQLYSKFSESFFIE